MKSSVITVPAPVNGTGWVVVDISSTALAPLAVGDPLILNPVDTNANITTVGLAMAFVSAANTISFGLKTQSAPIDFLVATP